MRDFSFWGVRDKTTTTSSLKMEVSGMAGDSVFRPFRHGAVGHSDRAAGDRQRHRAKVRDSIKRSIGDIIAEESIIGQDGDKVVKVPIRGIKEHRFIYGSNQPGAATGNGKVVRGTVVGKVRKEGDGPPDKAGDRPGEDYYETEITLDELIELMFEDLQLPELERKRLRHIDSLSDMKRKGYRKVGIRVRLDKHRTVKNKLRRKKALGVVSLPDVVDDDGLSAIAEEDHHHYVKEADGLWHLRFSFIDRDETYRHMDEKVRHESNAVVICMMDTSGSMDTVKKYLARSFFFLLYQFVRTKYQRVEIVFVAHHTEAREVTEEEFFHKGESGGTMISSAYRKTLELIGSRYNPELWNVYAFHCSDGDNFDSDNKEATRLLLELTKVCNLVGYGEIKPLGSRHYEGSMLEQFKGIDEENFVSVLIEKKEDLWPVFEGMLKKERVRS